MADPKPFVDALSAYDTEVLRAAFRAAQAVTGDTYDRTTLNRWLKGTVPTNVTFVEQFATELGDRSVYDAFLQAKRAPKSANVRTVVSRYAGLNPQEKDEAFHEIRGEYLSTSPSTRSKPTYRIEINDPPSGDDDHLIARVTLTWEGAVPAKANIRLTSEQKALGVAYSDPNCIYRDAIDLGEERLNGLLANGPDQVLAINPLTGSAPVGIHYVGSQEQPGYYQFENEASTSAKVRLSLSYPHPRGRPFLISYGNYQVPDVVEVTLVLNSRVAAAPRAFPFMPPGRRREYSSSYIGSDELFLTLGRSTTVFGDGDGVVLHWTES